MKKTILTFLFITTIFAQDVVLIVSSGDGPTKDQATTAALRNAIEQAYGAFISSNTQFLNDELIQDEITSVAQGNIQEYSIISSIETKNGYNVTTKSTVSLGKLTSFAESLHFEMKRKNVRVSLISPGFIKTPMTDQNDFPMPMIRSPEFAAEQIYIGLTKKNGFEIHFPKVFTYMMKFLRILPSSIYFRFLEKGMKKINY